MKKLITCIDYSSEYLDSKCFPLDSIESPTLKEDADMDSIPSTVLALCEVVAVTLAADNSDGLDKRLKTFTLSEPLMIYYHPFDDEPFKESVAQLNLTVDEYVNQMYELFDKKLENELQKEVDLQKLEIQGEKEDEGINKNIHPKIDRSDHQTVRTGT